MHGWDEIRRWRNEQREDLNARRLAIPQAERRRLQPLILDLVERQFPELVGFYWPFRGEVGVLTVSAAKFAVQSRSRDILTTPS